MTNKVAKNLILLSSLTKTTLTATSNAIRYTTRSSLRLGMDNDGILDKYYLNFLRPFSISLVHLQSMVDP